MHDRRAYSLPGRRRALYRFEGGEGERGEIVSVIKVFIAGGRCDVLSSHITIGTHGSLGPPSSSHRLPPSVHSYHAWLKWKVTLGCADALQKSGWFV
jgi:hypothetical protein